MYLNSVILSEIDLYCWSLKPQGIPTLQPALRGTEIHQDFNPGLPGKHEHDAVFPVPGLFPAQPHWTLLKMLSLITSRFPLLFSCAPSIAVCVYSPKMQPRAWIVPEVQCVHALLWMRDGRVVPLFFQVLRTFQQALSGCCGEVKALAKTNSKMSCTISQCLWLVAF